MYINHAMFLPQMLHIIVRIVIEIDIHRENYILFWQSHVIALKYFYSRCVSSKGTLLISWKESLEAL